jgi:membrane protease YdiL (CAAX protease family)
LRDLITALFSFSGLTLIALALRLLSRLTPLPGPPELTKPQEPLSWCLLIIFCLASGYLEEGYFRVYIEARLRAGGFGNRTRLLISCGLFTLCHLYQGPVGLCNAALAGLFLLLLYRKTGAPHGLALGHGCYNILVYVLS